MSNLDNRNATPIHPVLRAWIGAEIFFAAVASSATFLDPARAGQTDPAGFAWTIPVLATAATLGGFSAAVFLPTPRTRRSGHHPQIADPNQ